MNDDRGYTEIHCVRQNYYLNENGESKVCPKATQDRYAMQDLS